jgi:NAD(P)-dependent dehydrogenase (short-subunit alcohol dehydrogenase family)
MNHVLIVGGNRGIGLELARQLRARGDRVAVTCRAPSDELASAVREGIVAIEGVDVTDDSGVARVVEATASVMPRVDWLVLAAGLLEPNALDPLDPTALASIRRQFEVNALAPLRFASALRERIPNGGKLAILTSRMGSIADNTSGGHYGYRMSKAALNAAGKSLALDLAKGGIAVAILHPGFVRTRMTRENGLIDADESARLLIARIDALEPDTSGTFWHSNGDVLPW